MSVKKWIPPTEDDLVDLQEKWYEDLPKGSLQTAYGWNATECSETVVKIGTFLTARKAYKDVNSSANRIDKDEKKAKSIKAMRDFANSSIRFNKKMTDAQKLRYGIRVPDDTKTSHGVPAHQPETFSRSLASAESLALFNPSGFPRPGNNRYNPHGTSCPASHGFLLRKMNVIYPLYQEAAGLLVWEQGQSLYEGRTGGTRRQREKPRDKAGRSGATSAVSQNGRNLSTSTVQCTVAPSALRPVMPHKEG